MTPRRERAVFVGAMLALWLVLFVQAVDAPTLLDDWFQIRYWRDHAFGLRALWDYGYYNYFHYNPRIGDVILAIVDRSRVVHLIATPLVELAALVATFTIAFARGPRSTLRDLQLLLFIQVMIWLVIPISGIIYFYRPIATNYLWAFTITLALFVPYRLALAHASAPRRAWLVPIMLALGWVAGMCNEHTGPTAMVTMAAFVWIARRRRILRAWMISGLVGLYVGYPMLVFAPGQTVRYFALATRATPGRLLAERGVIGCLGILVDFIYEARLGIVLFVAALVRWLITLHRKGERVTPLPRASTTTAVVLAAAAGSIVVTLFISPTATDRVFYASGVLVAAAFAVVVDQLFAERPVRRLVVAACVALFAYHAIQFIVTYAAVKAENEQRIALLSSTPPGTVARVPPYEHDRRSRWHIGDDFQIYPWLGAYVGSELYDLADVEVKGTPPQRSVGYVVARAYDPPLSWLRTLELPIVSNVPTYRQWQRDPFARVAIAMALVPFDGRRLARLAIVEVGLALADAKQRPIFVMEWTPHGFAFVDGAPYDDARGHFIRVRSTSLPEGVESMHVIGCGHGHEVKPIEDESGDLLVPLDERECRGVFTAVACTPERCWVAGWY